jgi:hypothetical protein
MHARIATFELGEAPDEMIEQVRSDLESGSLPAALEDAKGMMLLVDRGNRKAMAVVLFESEEAMKRGDEALNSRSPSGGGHRTGVEFFEVAIQRMT